MMKADKVTSLSLAGVRIQNCNRLCGITRSLARDSSQAASTYTGDCSVKPASLSTALVKVADNSTV
jgi:hypothetical protein